MKKALLILALTLSIQTINAHPSTAHHTHDSLIQEWVWILIPCIILFALIWKFGRKNYFDTNKR